LDEIEQFSGFSGQRGIGVHLGSTPPWAGGGIGNAAELDITITESPEEVEAAKRDEHVENMQKVTDFFECIM
jgi:hypothetical protein